MSLAEHTRGAVEMPGSGNRGKAPLSHRSHSPWKSLWDSHIPTAPTTTIFSLKHQKQRKEFPDLGIRVFRLILGLENAFHGCTV